MVGACVCWGGGEGVVERGFVGACGGGGGEGVVGACGGGWGGEGVNLSYFCLCRVDGDKMALQ